MEASWGGLRAKVLKRPYTEPRVKILQFVVIFTYKGLAATHRGALSNRGNDLYFVLGIIKTVSGGRVISPRQYHIGKLLNLIVANEVHFRHA